MADEGGRVGENAPSLREVDMLDAQHYAFKEILKDGAEVTVRAAHADDGPRIRRAFMHLDRDTIHSRFFGLKKAVSDKELRRITDMDFDRDVSLLVTIPSGNDEIVIGGASYFSVAAEPPRRSAEVAFTVVQDYRGLGVASMLMRRIVGIARERGFTQLEADILDHNRGMMGVFRATSLPMTHTSEGNVIHLTMTLREGPLVPIE
jgi:GNAT superfamily N-acetyltransferase